jgi:hypothetical protein
MKKLFFALSLVTLAAVFVSAQDDYKKGEFFVGYSNGQVDTGFSGFTSVPTGIGDRTTFHGFNTSGVYNLGRYVGVKADVSGTYNTTRFSFPVTTGATTQTVSFDTSNALYNVLGGVQIKDNSTEKRFKPFVHALGGLGHARAKISNVTCTTTVMINCAQILEASENGFAAALGGGIDIRVNDRIDFRLVQIDYNPVILDESTSHNYRFGIGIVFK